MQPVHPHLSYSTLEQVLLLNTLHLLVLVSCWVLYQLDAGDIWVCAFKKYSAAWPCRHSWKSGTRFEDFWVCFEHHDFRLTAQRPWWRTRSNDINVTFGFLAAHLNTQDLCSLRKVNCAHFCLSHLDTQCSPKPSEIPRAPEPQTCATQDQMSAHGGSQLLTERLEKIFVQKPVCNAEDLEPGGFYLRLYHLFLQQNQGMWIRVSALRGIPTTSQHNLFKLNPWWICVRLTDYLRKLDIRRVDSLALNSHWSSLKSYVEDPFEVCAHFTMIMDCLASADRTRFARCSAPSTQFSARSQFPGCQMKCLRKKMPDSDSQ